MSNYQQSDSFSSQGKDEYTKNLKDYLYHWPLFVLGIIVCLFGAFVYLRYAPKVYSINTVLLIKDQKSSGPAAGGDLLNELDLFGNSKVVDNEIEILKSKTLMRKVVERLNLSVNFAAEGRIKTTDIYSNKPVDIQPIQVDQKWYGHKWSLSFPNSDNYVLEEENSGQKISGRLNKIERNALGVLKVQKLVQDPKLNEFKIQISFVDPKAVADQYLAQLSVTLTSKQSTVLTLGLESTEAERGEDILNTLVQVYNEAALADKNRTTQSTLAFIDERLKLITGELTGVEKDVESFKSSRGLTDLSNDANLFLEGVKINDAKLNEINLQLSVIRDIEAYVRSKSAQGKLPNTFGINDPVLIGQITELAELQLKRDQLLATTTMDNPLVAPLLKQIETTRAGIISSVANIAQTLEVSRLNLEGNNSKFQSAIKKIPGQERQLISIKRQQAIKESLYLYLLQKKEEAALSYASAVADSRTVDPAFSSNQPVKPKRQLIYLISIMAGIMLPLAFLYVRDILNDKVESSSDLSNLTSAPIIGGINYNEGSESIVVQENSRKAIAEQFRSIRTNMQYLHGKNTAGSGNVTLFTSGMSGEGKSFVAINLGTALAMSGRKTVLLELDLRKPKISKYLEVDHNFGLSNFLIGKANIDEIVRPLDVHQNLFIISSGPIPPNPSELLVGLEMDTLIDYLRSNFDEILIDSPPIGLVTDAQILSRFTDVTIYLVRENVTFKEQVKNLQLLYEGKKFPKLNVILNGVRGGGKRYGSSYGYGYYSDDYTPDRYSWKGFFKTIFKRF